MDHSQLIFLIIIIFILLDFSIQKILDYLNNKNWKVDLPEEAKDFYNEEKYAEAKKYHEANARLNLISGFLSLLLTLGIFIFGGFKTLNDYVNAISSNPILISLLYFGILGITLTIISLPFSWYQTFVIEEKFKFNKSTPWLFVLDLIKGLILSAILGGIIIGLIQYVYLSIPLHFWWIAGFIVISFTLFFAMFYTTLIVPIFNKLTPLEEGSLKNKISSYCKEVDFPLTEISVIDGSKRSNKSNAYFSGLGAKKSIVLFDTLIKELSEEEIVAVLAHEVGHYKEKHIYKSMILSVIQIGIIFFLLGYFLKSSSVSRAFGIEIPSFHIALIGFSFLYSPFSSLLGLMMLYISRKNEYEADAYAKKTYDEVSLMTALKKMSVNHLSNLTPHPWYVFFHYSHPPILDRLKSLNK